jgi:hypothetical protein
VGNEDDWWVLKPDKFPASAAGSSLAELRVQFSIVLRRNSPFKRERFESQFALNISGCFA